MELLISNGQVLTDGIFINHYWTDRYLRIMSYYQNNPICKNVYGEIHHIIPRSFFSAHKNGRIAGNPNCKENLVRLPAKVHYIAHLILTKICIDPIDRMKMTSALWYMMNRLSLLDPCFVKSGRLYGKLKIVVSTNTQQRFTGRKFTDEHSRRKSLAQMGIKNHRYGKANPNNPKLEGDKNGMFGKKHSPESIELMRVNRKLSSVNYTDELLEKLSNACKNKSWFNNGILSKRYVSGTEPDGFVKGRLKTKV